MYIKKNVLAHVKLNHRTLPFFFVFQKQSIAANFYDSSLSVSYFYDGMNTGKEREVSFIVLEEFVLTEEQETRKWNDQILPKNPGKGHF